MGRESGAYHRQILFHCGECDHNVGGEHRADWITTYPFSVLMPSYTYIKGHPKSKGPVRIGNDVWIGRDVMILSGVDIGDGAVVGAGSVVSKDIPPYAIVAGNPARIIRYRFAEHQIKALLRIRWWDWPQEKVRAEIPLLLSDRVDEFIRRHDQSGGTGGEG